MKLPITDQIFGLFRVLVLCIKTTLHKISLGVTEAEE